MRFRAVLLVVLALLLGDLSASAVPQLSRGDRQEVEQGAEADEQIEAHFGFYEDAELSAYVTGIGERLAALSERPQLPWTFRVLDSPVVNAFALPGGYVYVTRGLLAYAGTEAELAGVLGHEIGHVTGKHSRSRSWRSLGAQLAILGASVLSDTVADLASWGVPQLAAELLVVRRYSRRDELDADERGIGYATRAGYDPYGIGGFFETLQSLEERSGGAAIPGWASTHPQVDDRIERGNRWAAESLQRSALRPDDLVTGRRELLAEVDGVVFGDNPREGYMSEDDFLHPDLAFALSLPPGWSVQNRRDALMAFQPDEHAFVRLEVAPVLENESPEEYMRTYLREVGADVEHEEPIDINGLDAVEVAFTTRDDGAAYAILGTWIVYDDRVYQLLGVTSPSRRQRYATTMRRSMRSFAELTDAAALQVEPKRVAVVDVDRAMQLVGVIENHGAVAAPAQTVAILNHMSLDDLIAAGDVVKLIVGGPAER